MLVQDRHLHRREPGVTEEFAGSSRSHMLTKSANLFRVSRFTLC
jgi:hypothetical protein